MSKHNKNGTPGGLVVSTQAPKAKEVFIAGTFNDWNPKSHPLTHMGNGHWVLTLHLPPGRYEYKFISDGQWCCEPGCDKACQGRAEYVANPFGTMNRVLVVEETTEHSGRQRQLA